MRLQLAYRAILLISLTLAVACASVSGEALANVGEMAGKSVSENSAVLERASDVHASSAIKGTTSRRLLQRKRPPPRRSARGQAAATEDASVSEKASFQFEDGSLYGIAQSLGYFDQWARFIFFTGGVFSVSGDTVIRAPTVQADGSSNYDAAAPFHIISTTGKTDNDKICFGDTFYMRLNDNSDRYLYVAPNGNLMLARGKRGDPSAVFTMQVKHGGCPNSCIGKPLMSYEDYGEKLVHVATGYVCGGSVGGQMMCNNKVGPWPNYQLTLTG